MADFKWDVAVRGYAWAEDYRFSRPGRGGPLVSDGRVLVPRDLLSDVEGADGAGFLADDKRVAYRTYDPFGQTGMFRDFADTPPTEPEIRKFADRYGALGADGGDLYPLVKGSKRSENEREGHEMVYRSAAVAQTFDHWRDAITAMKRAVDLWAELTNDPKESKVKESKVEELQALVQERLEVAGVFARFRLKPPPARQPPLHLAPVNLHGAMWLQFALVVSGNNEVRQCPQCGRWFEVSPAAHKKTKLYCKEPCKSRAYRARISSARELRAAGRTVSQIAEELNVEVEVVRGWLKK